MLQCGRGNIRSVYISIEHEELSGKVSYIRSESGLRPDFKLCAVGGSDLDFHVEAKTTVIHLTALSKLVAVELENMLVPYKWSKARFGVPGCHNYLPKVPSWPIHVLNRICHPLIYAPNKGPSNAQ